MLGSPPLSPALYSVCLGAHWEISFLMAVELWEHLLHTGPVRKLTNTLNLKHRMTCSFCINHFQARTLRAGWDGSGCHLSLCEWNCSTAKRDLTKTRRWPAALNSEAVTTSSQRVRHAKWIYSSLSHQQLLFSWFSILFKSHYCNRELLFKRLLFQRF
jgi:hypothetical protein